MKKVINIFYLVLLLLGCKDTTDDGPIVNPNLDPQTPVFLVFPYEDELCNEGTNPTPTESTVFFEWEPNNNADNYILSIENLASGDVNVYETEDFIFPVTIERAVAFRWFVDYNIQNEVKTSAVWNFYNAGPGIQTYPPFPANIIAPSMSQSIASTNSVTLQWSGSDVDNDIVAYDVYFGTANPPIVNANNISSSQLNVSVAPGNIYYWNVVTKDAEGNSSESGVQQFYVLE
ncbi:hypothetical protein [Winogradskyella sp. PE311]|uniref:hypothetical protein n=1 Tax=Winogradskyella sp. PE311 TaxID=3366943 RepID=UPI00397F3446